MERGHRFGVNNMKFVLSTFRESLFALTHAYTFAISTLILSTIKSSIKQVCVISKQDRHKQLGD